MRRLSVGVGLLPPGGGSSAHHGSSQSQAPNRRVSRKSFGTELPASSAAAAPSVTGLALSQMYQTVLKLSSENKITAKNSWQLPLIENMERIMCGNAARGGGGGGGSRPKAAAAPRSGGGGLAPIVEDDSTDNLIAGADAALLNFQKASCTLDASVRIWSCRVDDTWNTSFRVLENMARGDGKTSEEVDEEEGADEKRAVSRKAEAKAAAAAAAAAAAQAAAADGGGSSGVGVWVPGAGATLERNPASLLAAPGSLSETSTTDPLFTKMSAECGGGSEGSTAGLLLLRLAVYGGCTLGFDSSRVGDVDGMAGCGVSYPAGVGVQQLHVHPLAAAAAAAAAGHGMALKDLTLSPGLTQLYESLNQYGGGPTPSAAAASTAAAALPAPAQAAAAAATGEEGDWARLQALSAATQAQPALPPAIEEALKAIDDSEGPSAQQLQGGGGGSHSPAAASPARAAYESAALLCAAAASAPAVDWAAEAGVGGGEEGSGGGGGEEEGADFFGGGEEGEAEPSGEAGSSSSSSSSSAEVAYEAHFEAQSARAPLPTAQSSLASCLAAFQGGSASSSSSSSSSAPAASSATTIDLSSIQLAVGVSAKGAGKGAGLAAAGSGRRAGALWKGGSGAAAPGAGAAAAAAAAAAVPGLAGKAKAAAGGRKRAAGAGSSSSSSHSGALDFSALPPASTWARLATASSETLTGPARVKMAAAAKGGAGTLPPVIAQGMLEGGGVSLRPLSGATLLAHSILPLALKPCIVLQPCLCGEESWQAMWQRALGGPVGGARAVEGGEGASAAMVGGGGGGGQQQEEEEEEEGGYFAGGDGDDYGGELLLSPGAVKVRSGGRSSISGAVSTSVIVAALEMTAASPSAAAPLDGAAPPAGEASAAAAAGSAALQPPPPPTMVAAARNVEQIRVRYETVSKNVNVSALKGNFSAALERYAGTGGMGRVAHAVLEKAARSVSAGGGMGPESAWVDRGTAAAAAGQAAGRGGQRVEGLVAAGAQGPALAFSTVIRDLAPGLTAQVTVPYYFITLLHLANEHGLAITDQAGLGDLAIRRLD